MSRIMKMFEQVLERISYCGENVVNGDKKNLVDRIRFWLRTIY